MSSPEKYSLAQRLELASPEIVRQWERKVRATVPAARCESRHTLRDSIPQFLAELVKALSGTDAIEPAPQAPKDHAEQRAGLSGYSLEQVIREYNLLRGTILDVLEAAEPIKPAGLRIILDRIDLGIAEAASRYVDSEGHALRESEERFRLLIANVKDYAIFMIDPEGRVMTWNQGAERIKGYKAEEIVGKHFSVFYTEEDAKSGKPSRGLETATQHGRFEDIGTRVRKDGSTFCANVLITALRDVDGKLRGFAKITRDVTERMAMEDELRRQANDLVAVNRRKDEFLATLAHELRNPLASITNSAEILKLGQREPGVAAQARDVIESQGKHLARLVDDLLDLARITQDKISLRKTPVDLKLVVDQVAETLRPFVEEREQRLSIAVADERIMLKADFIRLSQVLSNIVHNSAKFTDRLGQICVDVWTEQSQAIVRIRDTGAGIDAALLPHIFDMFTQGGQTLSGTSGGLGIGLTLSRKLVEMHGGSISAQSEGPGMGTTFVIRLPLMLPEISSEHTLEMTHAKIEQAPPIKNILIVDDNVDAATSLATLLGLCGHSVRTVHSGREALYAIDAKCPDTVILDIGLPDIDGYQVARQIRLHRDCSDVQLIALSGYGQEQDLQKSQLAGLDAHLTKPADLASVQNELAKERRR